MSVTSADDRVAAVIDLLEAAASTEWTPAEDPNIRHYWDDAASEKGPGADQPAVLYVWSPTGATLEQFSMDGEKDDRTDAIEIQAWSLDDAEAHALKEDITNILQGYLDDNSVQTPYSTVRPTTVNDFREQKPARQTDHFVTSVETDLRGLDPTE